MLITYHSNHLENLADRLTEVVSEPLGSPLAQEIIIVQSNGMARWLSLHLAKRLGICANVRFPFPAAFIWEIYRTVLSEVPETSSFEPNVLVWRIMEQLQMLEEAPCFAPLLSYLDSGDDFLCYELAYRIADTYDQYLVFRPDWINRWEAGEDEHWQAELWRRLTATDALHRARLRERFFQTLGSAAFKKTGLPARISLIGIPAMPPVYLEILARLAELLDVHLFMLNPCREYWGDIVAERDIARRGVDVEPEALYLEVGNSLLASLGKQGRDFIDLTVESQAQVVESFEEPPEDTLLHCLQTDILNLHNRGSEDRPATPVGPQDRSLQVHACHSAMREAEVLYDQLLALFQDNPELSPADVLVMTPDIEAYAPYIEAVFASAEGERYIPFSIADRSVRVESPLVDAFFGLLEFPGSRFDANQVLAVLETAAVQRRFGFAEGDLTLVYRWVRETGIRWGIDSGNREEWDLPATREHTWRQGLDRLLLGYALPAGKARLLADILPYDEVEGGDAQVMGRLQTFAAAVFSLRDALAAPRPLAGWAETLGRVIERFIAPMDTEETEVQLLRDALEKMLQNGEQAGFREPVSLSVAKAALRRYLDVQTGFGHFLAGGVTFCAMVPMRSIPFQVICLIGMNNDTYPRSHRPLGFDLMARQFRRGDRSRRNDDRYLFLEALLSARRCLYLSYVGNSIRDNSVIPPSVLVSELLDAVAQGFYPVPPFEIPPNPPLPKRGEDDLQRALLKGGADDLQRAHAYAGGYDTEKGNRSDILEQIVTRHPLQAFSRRYFTGDEKLFSYSQELCEAGLGLGHGDGAPLPFISAGLPEPAAEWRTVELSQLLRFFGNPARYLLRQRLGIHLEEREGLLETREPFILDRITEQQLCEDLLALRLSGQALEEALPLMRGDGILPHGRVGECLFERERNQVEHFARKLEQVLPARELEPLDLNLRFGDMQLTGRLSGVTPRGILGYRLANVWPHDYLNLWIQHLVLSSLKPPGVAPVSHWLSRDAELMLRRVDEPETYLEELLAYYWQGLHRPLHFFPRSAFAYAKAAGSGRQKTDPEIAARRAWEGNDHARGEGENIYYQLALRGIDPIDAEFFELAEAVFRPVFEYLEEQD